MDARLARLEVKIVKAGIMHAQRVGLIREELARMVASPELLDRVLIKLSTDMADQFFIIAAEVYLIAQEASSKENPS